MSARALALVFAAGMSVGATPCAGADLKILVVDAEHLQSSMPLYAEIDRQAAAPAADGSRPAAERQLAAELRKGEVLTAVPEVIAQIAAAEHADLVLDREVASRLGEGGARDVTAAVQQALEQRFSGRPLEAVR